MQDIKVGEKTHAQLELERQQEIEREDTSCGLDEEGQNPSAGQPLSPGPLPTVTFATSSPSTAPSAASPVAFRAHEPHSPSPLVSSDIAHQFLLEQLVECDPAALVHVTAGTSEKHIQQGDAWATAVVKNISPSGTSYDIYLLSTGELVHGIKSSSLRSKV